MKNLSNNDLSELLSLMYRIKSEIKDYCHVSDLLPKTLTNNIESYYEKLCDEEQKRLDEEIY